MQAGRLREVVTIEEPVERQDDTGTVIVDNWRAWATRVRAAIEPIRANKRYEADQIQAAVDTVITLRFRPGLSEKMRVVHVSEYAGSPQIVSVYDIAGPPIHVRSRRREIQLRCIRRSAEGFRSNGIS